MSRRVYDHRVWEAWLRDGGSGEAVFEPKRGRASRPRPRGWASRSLRLKPRGRARRSLRPSPGDLG